MRIYIVRHGETTSNKDGIMQGQTEANLNENGKLLAKLTGIGLKNIHFDACYSSPLKRASDTAKIILNENLNDKPNIIYDDRIKEINLGSWEGKKFKGSDSEIDEALVLKFFKNPFLLPRIAGGEDANDVISRTKAFLDYLSTKAYNNVLVTTHGFALRAMLNFIYPNREDFWQGQVPYNCAVNILEYKDNKFSLIEGDKIYYDKAMAIDRYRNDK